jgi:hypothetical protein
MNRKLTKTESGRRHRELVAKRSREISASVREIAPLPPIKNPQRRIAARKDLKYFCEQYFPKKFKLAWSSYHLQVIERLQKILIQGGGKLALAMPRGSGKTSLAEIAVVWAQMCGHCRYIVIIGANKSEAQKIINSIKTTLTENKVLLDDFPEAIYPFRKLEGSALRARGQQYLGELTGIEWKPDSITFPKIQGSLSSGATIVSVGIRGAIRGKNKNMPDGEVARPDVVVLDDPQTDEAARSPDQVAKLESIIDKTIEGLVGPADELAMLMTCTVIQEGDLADRYLNHNIKPQWHGMRFKMIETMPERMDLWEKYKDIRKDDPVAATMFYKRNRTEMKAGAVAAWEANYTGNELDALQYAMNKWADNYETFMSEYQNEPLRPDRGAVVVPAKTIRSRLNGLDWQTLPLEAQTLTGFIDVHDDLLYYAVTAWSDDFTGFVIDYGTYPKQSRRYFSKGDTGLVTLNRYGEERKDGAIQAGLVTLIKDLMATDWSVEGDRDGAEHVTFSKLLIDTGYKPELVENAIRLAVGRSTAVMPAKGKGIRSSQTPMSGFKRKPGERFGNHWLENTPPRRIRTITVDTNYWKCQVHDGFSLLAGNRSGLTLWGRDPETHRMISEHLNAEAAKLTKTGENEVNEWQVIPNRDNHLFDCMVGCMVAASVSGIRPPNEEAPKEQKRIKLSNLQKEKWNRN